MMLVISPRPRGFLDAAGMAALWAALWVASSMSDARAEGSRTLYPASYPTAGGTCANAADRGCRANLDLQPGNRYANRIQRRTFLYVYAEAGEYLLLGSSNRSAGGDILVYRPQDFGTPGDETLPATADFSCASASPPAGSFGGGSLGRMGSRAQELAGPHSADGTATVANGYAPCAYRVPATGIHGVQFTAATSGNTNLNADIFNPLASTSTVAVWDVTVRPSAGSLADRNGRLFTYAWVAFAGVNNRPIFSRHDYVTLDGYRYSQSLAGLDPNGFALYANRLGFLDDGRPLYKGVRGRDSYVTDLAPGLSAQRAEFPIFFSSVDPAAPHAAEVDKVLAALQIPTVPRPPALSAVEFTGRAAGDGATTRTGAGGTFRLTAADAATFQIVVSRDGADFSAANTANAVIAGIAGNGTQEVDWDGSDATGTPFPASATPYAYRAFARAGEIHLPMIDAENNGNGTGPATATFGGGPTVTRLNGPQAGDTTVFFDDRGYATRGGTLVGSRSGTLCPAAPPQAPQPAQALGGVDSTLVYGAAPRLYRWWLPGANANGDCAATGGWGDAKGLDLWTYLGSPAREGRLRIDAPARGAAARLSVPGSTRAGAVVQGRFAFANHGTAALSGVQYTLAAGAGCSAPALAFANLPAGAAVQCVEAQGRGLYRFSGFPATLAGGERVRGAEAEAPLSFTYAAPASGAVAVEAALTAAADGAPASDTASGSTAIGPVDVQARVTVAASALPGETVSGTAWFANLGSQPAPGWTASLAIGAPQQGCPAGVAFTRLPPGVRVAGFDAATCTAALAGWPAALADGQFLTLDFRFTAPAAGQVAVRASVDGAGDADAGNNRASATTLVRVVDMVVSLAGLPPVALAGERYAGTFSCTNAGLLDALGGTRCAIDGGLPPGVSLVACTLDRTGAAWGPGDPVPAGATVTCRVEGIPTAGGSATLRAGTAATGDADAASNSATLALAVIAPRAVPSLTPPALGLLAALLGLSCGIMQCQRRPRGPCRRRSQPPGPDCPRNRPGD
ncbi:hypothetical protein [Paracidovorax anthurii]|uniref:DUF11 domain-containing protein n=1 Tax=Paracidovorax anthurii TaxID=78229 RepID=A0A328YVB0_9BURK|nr:hypothetical protein [Paracidovorax anthurii]RAR76112.1 hypothetical protein AX018_105414 [Paracidovorax anthurii]